MLNSMHGACPEAMRLTFSKHDAMSIFFYPRRRGNRREWFVGFKGHVRASHLQESRESDGDHLPCLTHSQLTNETKTETKTSEGLMPVAIHLLEFSDENSCPYLIPLDSFLHPCIQIFHRKKWFHPHAGFLVITGGVAGGSAFEARFPVPRLFQRSHRVKVVHGSNRESYFRDRRG